MKEITIEEAVKDLRELIQEYKDASVEGADMQVDVSFREERCRNLEKVLDELESEKEYHQYDVEKLQDYHKENSELNTKCVQLEYQLEKKNKIINAMATTLSGISEIRAIMGTSNVIASQDEIIKRYERKVKDE